MEGCCVRYVAEYERVYESGEVLFVNASLPDNALELSGRVRRLSHDAGNGVSVPAERFDRHTQDSDLVDRQYCVTVPGSDIDLFVPPFLLDSMRFDRLVDQKLRLAWRATQSRAFQAFFDRVDSRVQCGFYVGIASPIHSQRDVVRVYRALQSFKLALSLGNLDHNEVEEHG